jgi:hypothetical protein
MRKQTKILMRGRREILKEWASGPHDWITAKAVHFSGTEQPFAETYEQHERQLRDIKIRREKRIKWLQGVFPDEIWRIPILTSILLPEAGLCYANGVHYATIVMSQAVVESVLRREAGGYGREYWRLIKNLRGAKKLTAMENDDLLWLASVRNPTLHTGNYAKYARTLYRGLMPVIARGRITERTPIESDSKRAMKIVVELLHHLCSERPQQDF